MIFNTAVTQALGEIMTMGPQCTNIEDNTVCLFFFYCSGRTLCVSISANSKCKGFCFYLLQIHPSYILT